MTPSPEDSQIELKQQMLYDNILHHADATLTAFGGGVSSDVYLVHDGADRFVVKQVLEKLRVAADWHADTARIHCEQDFLRYVGERMPGAVPRLMATGDGYFTMEYLGSGFQNWKSMMLAGTFDSTTAARVGAVLGEIHRVSWKSAEIERLFPNNHFFHQLRIEPYLLATATRAGNLRDLIEAEAQRLGATHECLVHGDYSPKNIMVSDDRVVILDCETANYGDPSFDLAFVLTHVLLKGLYHSPATEPAHLCAQALTSAYFTSLAADFVRADEVNLRAARLLQIILLARVDGKSPAEYLTPAHHQFIRSLIAESLPHEVSLESFFSVWFDAAEHLHGVL